MGRAKSRQQGQQALGGGAMAGCQAQFEPAMTLRRAVSLATALPPCLSPAERLNSLQASPAQGIKLNTSYYFNV
eukprot:scaffold102141_cov39-Prasinocladus_malaysianus.AAC.1